VTFALEKLSFIVPLCPPKLAGKALSGALWRYTPPAPSSEFALSVDFTDSALFLNEIVYLCFFFPSPL